MSSYLEISWTHVLTVFGHQASKNCIVSLIKSSYLKVYVLTQW